MSPQPERQTISDIRRAVRICALKQSFRRGDVSKAIGRSLPAAFLPKHRVGNPDGETELFQQSIEDCTASSEAKDSIGSLGIGCRGSGGARSSSRELRHGG